VRQRLNLSLSSQKAKKELKKVRRRLLMTLVMSSHRRFRTLVWWVASDNAHGYNNNHYPLLSSFSFLSWK
jgi:hypothetical protein